MSENDNSEVAPGEAEQINNPAERETVIDDLGDGVSIAEKQPPEQEQTAAEEEVVEDNLVTTPDAQDLPASAKKRVNKFYAEKRAAEERERQASYRASQLENELHQYRNRGNGQQPSLPSDEEAPPDENDPRYANNPMKFAKDLVAYDRRQLVKAVQQSRQEEQQARQNDYLRTVDKQYRENVEVAREKYEDFNEVVEALPIQHQNPFSSELIVAIQECSNGADIAYYLGKNPSKLENLYKLNPRQAFAELGKMSVELERKGNVKTVKPSIPPKPLAGISGKGNVSTIEAMSTDELARYLRSRQY